MRQAWDELCADYSSLCASRRRRLLDERIRGKEVHQLRFSGHGYYGGPGGHSGTLRASDEPQDERIGLLERSSDDLSDVEAQARVGLEGGMTSDGLR